MKFETARIHFLSEVFIAVAFVVASLFRAFLRFYLSCGGSLNCQTASNRSIHPRSVYLGSNATLKGLRFTVALIFLGRRFMRVLNRVL